MEQSQQTGSVVGPTAIASLRDEKTHLETISGSVICSVHLRRAVSGATHLAYEPRWDIYSKWLKADNSHIRFIAAVLLHTFTSRPLLTLKIHSRPWKQQLRKQSHRLVAVLELSIISHVLPQQIVEPSWNVQFYHFVWALEGVLIHVGLKADYDNEMLTWQLSKFNLQMKIMWYTLSLEQLVSGP